MTHEVGSQVLTPTGQYEHLYAGQERTLCGKEVDLERSATSGESFWECLTCRKGVKGGALYRARRAEARRAAALNAA